MQANAAIEDHRIVSPRQYTRSYSIQFEVECFSQPSYSVLSGCTGFIQDLVGPVALESDVLKSVFFLPSFDI